MQTSISDTFSVEASSSNLFGSKEILPMERASPLIVGISGATGIIYGIRTLQLLREAGVTTHLVLSKAAEMTLAYETTLSVRELRDLADISYPVSDVGATIASGSFLTRGMIIAPCSIKTMSEIAHGITASLMSRAADVVLKERRRLVLLVRETPLTTTHLRNMLLVTESGGIIAPPAPAFYTHPQTIEEIVDQTVGRTLDLFDIDVQTHVKRWEKEKYAQKKTPTLRKGQVTMKQVKSLRDYIEALKQLGEVQEIEHEVDWNLEIGAIIRRCNETGAPAPLFNNIRGIEKGFRVFGAPVGVSQQKGLYLARIAMSLGLDARASGQELVTALAQAREKALIAPKRIETAPHKRHILKGEHVDLLRFPTPLIHQADGGRYFNTWGTIVVQSPDKKWTSWSITRIMLLDGKHMTGLLNPHQHVGRIHAMWRELGRPTPFALALGCEPAIPVISGMALPDLVDENAFLGAYFGEPLEVVRCDMSDLEVPATAEIVVEGTISQDEQALEGPMGEYLGYMGQEQAMQPIYTVTAISFRENPILPVVAAGEPIDDDHTVIGITGSAEILHVLQSNGVPARMVWSVLESANTWLVVTMPATWQQQTGMRKEALLQKIGDLVFSTKYSGFVSTILVMDDDIDPTNTSEVLWAFTTRCRPQIDVTYFADRIMVPLAPYLVPAEKKKAPFITKQVFNGLVDIPRGTDGRSPMRSSFAHCYPQELQNKVLQNWSSYGFRHV